MDYICLDCKGHFQSFSISPDTCPLCGADFRERDCADDDLDVT
jgi:rubrerythrin